MAADLVKFRCVLPPFWSELPPKSLDSAHLPDVVLIVLIHQQDGGSSSFSPYHRRLCLAFSGMYDGGNDERLLSFSQFSAHPTLHAEKWYA